MRPAWAANQGLIPRHAAAALQESVWVDSAAQSISHLGSRRMRGRAQLGRQVRRLRLRGRAPRRPRHYGGRSTIHYRGAAEATQQCTVLF